MLTLRRDRGLGVAREGLDPLPIVRHLVRPARLPGALVSHPVPARHRTHLYRIHASEYGNVLATTPKQSDLGFLQ